MEFTVWLLQMLASRMNLWQPPYINVIGKNLCRILWQPTERLELVAQTKPTHQQYSSSRFSFLAFHSTTVLRAANILDMFMEEIVSDTLVWGKDAPYLPVKHAFSQKTSNIKRRWTSYHSVIKLCTLSYRDFMTVVQLSTFLELFYCVRHKSYILYKGYTI